MALKDCIADIGLETWKNMSTSHQSAARAPYIEKSISDLSDKIPNLLENLSYNEEDPTYLKEESAEAVRKAKYNEVAEYIKKNGQWHKYDIVKLVK